MGRGGGKERKRKNKTAFITQHVLRTDGAELCIKAFYVAHVVERGSRARARVRNKMFSGEFSHLNPGVSPAVININTAGAAQHGTARLGSARSRSRPSQPEHLHTAAFASRRGLKMAKRLGDVPVANFFPRGFWLEVDVCAWKLSPPFLPESNDQHATI